MKTDAYLKTEHGSKYLQQLAKHFGHKIEVEFTETEGTLHFPFGPINMKADDGGLWIEVSGEDDATILRAKDVVDRHLARFAFREDFTNMPWAT